MLEIAVCCPMKGLHSVDFLCSNTAMVMGSSPGETNSQLGNYGGQAICRTLTQEQVDAMFFPGSGGKPTKAKAFCAQCPVISLCLREAIEQDYDGFFAGTTKDERHVMARHFHITPKAIDEFMPPEPERKRKIYRKVDFPFEDTLTHLNDLTNPLDLAVG